MKIFLLLQFLGISISGWCLTLFHSLSYIPNKIGQQLLGNEIFISKENATGIARNLSYKHLNHIGQISPMPIWFLALNKAAW
jgi:hypothetical protein